MEIDARINDLLQYLEPITLEQMKEIRLMNRTDTKFVTNKENLARLLELAQGKYYAQFNNDSKIANYMTTYWDTDDHRFYLEHHNGRAPRQKVRVRTYMDSDHTFLEVKTKEQPWPHEEETRGGAFAGDRWRERQRRVPGGAGPSRA